MTAYHHRTVFVGDIKTHFLEAGQGPELVLLHGGEYGASAEITWKHNIAPLAERFHVVAPDMLGWAVRTRFTISPIQRAIESII